MFRAQDWELNYRLRQSGRLVWFSPELRVTYRPRSTLKALIKQMYDTGKWRREVVRRHPDTASVRYLAPPAAVVAIGVGTLGALVGGLTGSRFLRLGVLAPGGYAAFVAYVMARHPRPCRPRRGAGCRQCWPPPTWPGGVGSWSVAADRLLGSRWVVCRRVATCLNFPSVDGFCGATGREGLELSVSRRKAPAPARRTSRTSVNRRNPSGRSIGPARRGNVFRTTSVPGRPTTTGIGRHLRRTADTSSIHSRLEDLTLYVMTTQLPKALNTRRPFTRKEALLSGLADNDLAGHRFPTYLPRHLRRRGRRDHRRSTGPSCAAGCPARLLCQPPHRRAAVGWVDASDLRDPPQLADHVDAVRTARCRGARGRPGTHASTAARSDGQPTGTSVLGTGVDTPEPGRSGGRGRLVGDRSRVVSDGSGRRS